MESDGFISLVSFSECEQKSEDNKPETLEANCGGELNVNDSSTMENIENKPEEVISGREDFENGISVLNEDREGMPYRDNVEENPETVEAFPSGRGRENGTYVMSEDMEEISIRENFDNQPETLEDVPNGEDYENGSSILNEDMEYLSMRENVATLGEVVVRESVHCIHTVDAEISSLQVQPTVQSMVTLEKVNEHDHKLRNEKTCLVMQSNATVSDSLIDEKPISKVKRARTTYVEEGPFVRVVYHSLTKESKKKLVELMQQWSEWHAQHQSSSGDASSKEGLEFGEEIYFPALHIGSDASSAVSFWIDNKARKEENKIVELDNDSVPFYDHGYTLGSTAHDGSANPESGVEALEASRCFNCGSYSHSLKECPKPRDIVAISSARKQHNGKRNATPASRGQVRYYVKAAGKFDGLKAGFLSAETRESLGIGELDPPPWLHRMRELGYPPGYLDIVEDEDQPSGITIFTDEELKEEYEEGELLEKGELLPPKKKMTVEFPGINAPVPDNADHRVWSAPPRGSSASSTYRGYSNYKSNNSLEANRSRYHERRWSSDYRDDGPPSSDHGLVSPLPPYSPRFSSNSNNSLARSPSLGGSYSDRGQRSPLTYESSAGQNTYGLSSYVDRWSPHKSSPSPRFEQWNSRSSYNSSPDVSHGSSWSTSDRHDHRHRHSRK